MNPPPDAADDRRPKDGPAGATEAVVLAAGRGVRLGELTRSTPKVLVKVQGRPLLDYHLEALHQVGVHRVVLVVGYLAEQVESYVDSGRAWGTEVVTARQTEARGTGDALRVAGPLIRSDPFLVCYADTFVPDLPDLLRSLLVDSRPKVVAAHVRDGALFGRLEVRREGSRSWLVRIREKDGSHLPALVNAGIYLLPQSVLPRVAGLAPSVRGEYELTDAVGALAAEPAGVEVVTAARWVDAGSSESVAQANEMASRPVVSDANDRSGDRSRNG